MIRKVGEVRKEDWGRFDYEYEHPEFLKSLVNIIGENGVEASVVLKNNELTGELEKEKNRFFYMDEKTFMENLEEYREFILKLKNKEIIPGWALVFDYYSGKKNNPKIEIEYVGRERIPSIEEPYTTLVNPLNFVNGRWELIMLKDFKGERNIRRLKEAVVVFIENGYTLVHVHALLNFQPYTPNEHYNGVGCENGVLDAGGGVLTIHGYFPKDFDFSIFVPKELPEGQKMLEQLVKKE